MKKMKKQCQHYLCAEEFETKNSKQKFCSICCKNEHAYLSKKENYFWEIEMQKERWKAIKLIEDLLKRKIFEVSKKEIKKIGINLNCAYVALEDELGLTCYRFGNCLVTLLSESIVKLSKYKFD